jgi:hypothetical protein
MTPAEAARRIGEVLDEDRIAYAIGGALALGVWGAPRATNDVDLSIFLPRIEVPRAIDSLERAGVILAREQAAKEVERIGLFVGKLGRIRIDVFLSEHPQYVAMAARARRIVDPNGWSGAYLSAEDITLYKLLYDRDKDRADLARLFAARPDLDVAYIRHWLSQMVSPGDSRLATLSDLERRFIARP